MFNRKTRRDLRRALAIETERRITAQEDATQARQVAQFEIRQREQVEAGARRVDDRNRALTELLDAARRAHHDGEYEQLEGRHARLLRAVVRYRAELAGQDRLIRDQQKRLDYWDEDPQIAAGADWQARRNDTVPGFQQPRTSSPSGLLPRREPGVTS